MRSENWRSKELGDGRAAFGREVDRRLAVRMSTNRVTKDRWVSDLLVNQQTRRIESIGANKSQKGFIQVDHIYMKAGEKPFQVGDNFDMTRVESVHDVKASAINRLRGQQRERLLRDIAQGHPVFTINTRWLYDLGHGFVLNPHRNIRERMFRLFGVNAAAFVAIGVMDSDDDFDALVYEAERIKTKELRGVYNSDAGKMQKKHDVADWTGKLCDYMSQFMVDGDSLDIVRASMTYAIFTELIDVNS